MGIPTAIPIAPITAVAALALFRFKVGVMTLLAACAEVGLIVTLGLPVLR